MKRRFLCSTHILLISIASVTSEATTILPLEGRNLDDNADTFEAYYDPNLDITWLENANYALTSGFDNDGLMDWNTATTWANELDVYGFNDWRLPSADVNGDGIVVDCAGGGVPGCEDNEMGFLYWEEGITNSANGLFNNVMPFGYWTNTESDSSSAYLLFFNFGTLVSNQFTNIKIGNFYAWAVRSGDVSTVPLPSAAWLFGSGLIGMLGMVRKVC